MRATAHAADGANDGWEERRTWREPDTCYLLYRSYFLHGGWKPGDDDRVVLSDERDAFYEGLENQETAAWRRDEPADYWDLDYFGQDDWTDVEELEDTVGAEWDELANEDSRRPGEV